MKRRHFIVGSAGAAVLTYSGYYFLGPVNYDTRLKEPIALSMILDEETIRQIGSTYREMVPNESSERALAGKLKNLSGDDFATKVVNQIDEDFKTGSTVLVNGWVLSITEARQCALFSIQSN